MWCVYLEKDLEEVYVAAIRAKDLVKQILAFSRQTEVERLYIKIQPLIKESLGMIKSTIPSTISITENIDPGRGAVLTDPTQVHQILMNLCTNACHFMEAAGGTISVALKTICIETGDEAIKGLGIKEFALKLLAKDVIAKLIRKGLDVA